MTNRILKDKSLRTMIAAAAIFLILGTGNLIFGNYKLDHYKPLLNSASKELKESTTHRKRDAILSPTLNVDRQTAYINKLRSAINLYSFVVLGGRSFLAISGIFLLAILVTISMRETKVSDKNSQTP